jgi:hypothetical protein
MAYDFNSLPRFYAVDWATFSGSTATKNPNSIYVITDLGLIYRGDTLATKGVQVLDTAPSEGIPGVLYYTESDGLFTFDGGTKQAVGTSADKINELIDSAIDALTVNGNTFGADGKCVVGADDIKMGGYVTVEGSTIGISSDSSITEAVTKLEEKVITLGALSGDAGEALEGIAERLQKVETATTVSVTGTADSSILNNYGTTDAAEYKVRNEYLPDVAVKGVNVAEGMGKRINFIGNCAVIADANGNLTVRIGDNLNSGCFMVSNDGQTNGTATAAYNVNPSSHTLANGTSATTWLKAADNTITIATAEEIHFDEPADGTSLGKFIATVGDKEYEFEIDLSKFKLSTGATTSSAVSFGTAPAVLTISDFGHEAKSADGATGYSGKISLVLNVEDMSFADGEIQVKLVQEGTAGAGELTLNKFYWLNDNATKASGTVTSVALSSISAKQLSGVVHLTAATVTYKANVSNVATPATQNASNSTITFTPNSWANNGSTNVNYNATTATATTTTLKTGVFTPTATVTAANINGSGSASAAVALSGAAKLSIDVTAAGTTNDLSEAFDTEARRLNDDKTAWDSSVSLATVNGLQVYKGTLVYPSVDFRTCNEGLTVTLNGSSKTIASGAQPNYNGLSGARSYVRKFTKSGAAMFSGKVTVKTSATIATAVSNGSFRVLVGKANGNWYNIGFGQAANADLDGTTANIGKSTSSFGTTSNFDFEFTDGAAADDVWVKIIMTSNVATVTEMSFA